ncbi:MAG: hypothetical protein LBE18_10075 [Planctomycetaceae bacterium]|jgi:hypothetical protein|nr:hypothetical protein [Planctomycetaceae bacterium]
MIEFTCPNCSKSYSLSERFAGRQMICADCKNKITVPSISVTQTNSNSDSNSNSVLSSISVPPPFLNNKPLTDLSPLPEFKSNTEVSQTDDTHQNFEAAITTNDAETALLAAVFTDKIQDKRNAEMRSKIPPPAPSKKILEPLPRKKFISTELIIFVTIMLLFAGTAVYFILFFDWLEPDMRIDLLNQLEDRRIKTTIAISGKESEIETLRVRSLRSWTSACNAIDTFIMTVGNIDMKNRDVLELDWNIALDTINESGKKQLAVVRDEIKNSIPSAELNLSKLKLQASEDVAKAETDELATDTAIHDAINLRAELQFYETEISKLKQQISNAPDDRPTVSFPSFDKKSLPPRETIKLNNDWTEEYYNQFAFSEVYQGNYFTTFDGIRRLFGNRSLRITLVEKSPITVRFPTDNITANELKIVRTFNFAMRFPDLTDAIMVGEERNPGQFSEIQIRFINKAGQIEFKTKSREYCDAIFYSGRGKFVSIEFSLEGDEFWTRLDNFDKLKLTNLSEKKEQNELTEEEIKAMTNEAQASEIERETAMLNFFKQIDSIEFRLIPVSKRTTFWIDGIAVSDKKNRKKIDLVQANLTKRTLQELEQDYRKKRRQRSVMHSLSQISGFQNWQQDTEQPEIDPLSANSSRDKIQYESDKNTTSTASKEPAAKNPIKTNNTEPKNTAADNNKNTINNEKERLFKWVLNDAKGRIKASYNNRLFTFGNNAKLPDNVNDYNIEQISIANYKITEAQLDQIVKFITIKRLELESVGLNNSDVLKLSVLKSLEMLSLANNQLTYEALPAIKTLQKLRELNLSGIRMSVDGIDSLGVLRSLVSLNLSKAEFDSNDLNYCATLTNLEILNLSGTKVGDRVTGIMQMLNKLKEINLSKTNISNRAIDSLFPLNNLEILLLDEVELDNDCLESMGKIANLKTVSARKTKITKEGIQQKLPNTKIKFNLDSK